MLVIRLVFFSYNNYNKLMAKFVGIFYLHQKHAEYNTKKDNFQDVKFVYYHKIKNLAIFGEKL